MKILNAAVFCDEPMGTLLTVKLATVIPNTGQVYLLATDPQALKHLQNWHESLKHSDVLRGLEKQLGLKVGALGLGFGLEGKIQVGLSTNQKLLEVANLVIEAVEGLEAKRAFWKMVTNNVKPDTLCLSNSSDQLPSWHAEGLSSKLQDNFAYVSFTNPLAKGLIKITKGKMSTNKFTILLRWLWSDWKIKGITLTQSANPPAKTSVPS